ncbi:ATP-dependent DNA ligase [Nonomuraea dietziae]|uniref:ATP-dependent DNA ligase n=1 Tax=Nonomuraea dietziae TaxID=65515 RepID=UPI00342DB1A9
MRAKVVDRLPEGPAGSYLYEPKWDGFRCIAMVTEDRGVHLQSRRRAHLNDLFPEVAWALHEYLPAATVVDGESVRWAPDGRLDCTALQRRNMAGRRAEDLSRTEPCHYIWSLHVAGVEGLVIKPAWSRYKPAARGWYKLKHRTTTLALVGEAGQGIGPARGGSGGA